VADLKATFSSAGALLTFTADPTRTYTLDASGDGSHWTQLGTAQPGQTAGSFQFQDAAGGTATERFYRVVTH
jgi:hypothetical protein